MSHDHPKSTERLFKLTRFRWEFLRRNVAYIRDYDRYVEGMLTYKFPNHARLSKFFVRRACFFIKKYSINFPIHPDIEIPLYDSLSADEVSSLFANTTNQIHETVELSKKSQNISKLSEVFQSLCISSVDVTNQGVTQDLFGNISFRKKSVALSDPRIDPILRINIDTRSDSQLIELQVKSILSAYKSELFNKKNHRKQIKKYQMYLDVFDLREAGSTYKEIAEKVYPKEYKKYMKFYKNKYDLEPLIEKVASNYESAVQLINGRFKIIE